MIEVIRNNFHDSVESRGSGLHATLTEFILAPGSAMLGPAMIDESKFSPEGIASIMDRTNEMKGMSGFLENCMPLPAEIPPKLSVNFNLQNVNPS